MRYLALALCILTALAQPKPPPAGQGADAVLKIDAVLLLDRPAMKQAIGEDPGDNIVTVQVTLTPAPGQKVKIVRDDFLLRSDKDGQKSGPLHPSQIAGDVSLVVSSVGGNQGAGMAEQRRVPWGIPGTPGQTGPPATLPTNQPPTTGVATADTSSASGSIEENKRAGANPLMTALKAKVLTDQDISAPVTGLLYFAIEGKHKPKEIELVYRKSPPRLSVRFKEKK